jgi:hypothetical protein
VVNDLVKGLEGLESTSFTQQFGDSNSNPNYGVVASSNNNYQ